MLSVTRYSIKNERLKPWIKFIWHFEAEDADIHNKLLPTDCIDVILNLSGNMVYEVDSSCVPAAPLHINGLRSKYSYIRQMGDICVFGISFYPFGLYPFVNKSLTSIHDKIIDLQELSPSLAQSLAFAVTNGGETENIIDHIEKALSLNIQVTEDYLSKTKLILDYLESDHNVTMQSFCLEHGINTKTFGRNVLRYTGYMPKVLRSIKRFQKAGNQLVHQEDKLLADVAYDNDFADQAHFIREFHKYAGASPCVFRKQKTTVKENTKYDYR